MQQSNDKQNNEEDKQDPNTQADIHDHDNGDSNKSKRNPFCSRCRNHGKSAQVKGHKRHCEYRSCQCEGCKLVECRQLVSAAQIKRRRHQKQDEECGRRIEISPPVLTCSPRTDPTALIAKTFMGSNQTNSIQLGQSCTSAHLRSSGDSLAATSSLTNHYHNGVSNHSLNSHSIYSLNQRGPGTNLVPNTDHHLPLHQHQHQQPQQHPHQPTNAVLSNALHLFHYPSSVLSAAASLGTHLHRSSMVGADPSGDLTAVSLTSSLPSYREQINLVDEIHQVFGPLAIYAWLRSEHFDLRKIRDLIELSRSPYYNLMDFKSKYRLDLNGTNGIENNIFQQQQKQTKKSPSNLVDCSPNPSSAAPKTSASTSSPLYTLGNGYCNNSNNTTNDSNATVTSAAQHLASTLNSLSMNTAPLWSGLKLTSSEGASIESHSQHLLPHFVHHPFLAHQIHQHHQQRTPPTATVNIPSPSTSSSTTIVL